VLQHGGIPPDTSTERRPTWEHPGRAIPDWALHCLWRGGGESCPPRSKIKSTAGWFAGWRSGGWTRPSSHGAASRRRKTM